MRVLTADELEQIGGGEWFWGWFGGSSSQQGCAPPAQPPSLNEFQTFLTQVCANNPLFTGSLTFSVNSGWTANAGVSGGTAAASAGGSSSSGGSYSVTINCGVPQ